MQVNWIRFIVAVIAAYLVYAVLYTGAFLTFPGMQEMALEVGRTEDDPLIIWQHVGHVLETATMVLLYFLFIRSNNAGEGALYGGLIGLYFAATQVAALGSLKNYYGESLTFELIPLHIIFGMIVGFVLSKLYKAPAAAADS